MNPPDDRKPDSPSPPLTDDRVDHGERQRLESFAEISGGWFWETDADHRFRYLSRNVENVTGVPPEWHYGKSRAEIGVPDAVHPDDWARHLAALEKHEPFRDFVFRREGPDGVKWLQTTGKPVYAEDGRFAGYRGFASDVTARVETQHRLDAMGAAVDQLSDVFVLWDRDDRLLFCNETFRDLNQAVVEATEPGTSFEAYLRASLAAGQLPNAVGREEAWLAERLERHRNPGAPFEIARPGGTHILVIEQRLADGATVTISTDITDLRRSEAEAREKADTLRTALTAIPDGMAILDGAHNVLDLNDTARDILGLARDAAVDGETFARTLRRAFAGSGDDGALDLDIDNLLETSRDVTIGRYLANGRWAEIRSFPIRAGGRVVSIRDFTEQHELDRLKSEFLSTVSHELRTPLTALLGSLSLMAGGAVGEIPESAQGVLKIARDNGKRLLNLINDLLDIERITSGRMQYDMAPVSVDDLLFLAVQANQSYAEQYEVDISIVGGHARARVRGDQRRLLQVLANLISNAAKFSPPGSRVDLAAGARDGAVEITVTDRGRGIPEEFQGRVFEKFAQADGSSSRGAGGSGLGLAISKAIVDEHGGEIAFDSTVGEGTTFRVTLPILAD